MVQAIPAIKLWVLAGGAIAASTVAAINTILINVALGSLSYRDETGRLWVATNE